MRAEAIRERLASGPATWAELMEASGLSEQRCMVEVSKLQSEGVTIRLQKVTLVECLYDPERPAERFCAEPGCGRLLRHTNGTGWCSLHVQGEALRRWNALPEDRRKELAAAVCGDPCAIAELFDTQLSLEQAMVSA